MYTSMHDSYGKLVGNININHILLHDFYIKYHKNHPLMDRQIYHSSHGYVMGLNHQIWSYLAGAWKFGKGGVYKMGPSRSLMK